MKTVRWAVIYPSQTYTPRTPPPTFRTRQRARISAWWHRHLFDRTAYVIPWENQ